MAKPRIGISPDNEWREGNPSRPFYFLDAQNFVALNKARALPFMLVHDVSAIEDYLDTLDGIVISGGGYQFQDSDRLIDLGATDAPAEKRARLDFEWALIEAALKRDMPVLAVCGGVQTLNAVLGGRLVVSLAEANPAWSRHRDPPYNKLSHDVTVLEDTLLHRLTQSKLFAVNSLHRQGIIEVGPGVVVSASADDGIVEAIEVPKYRFCLGVQWHPEFDLTPADQLIFDGFVRACQQ
jgi:putative glutamine amidotransferase